VARRGATIEAETIPLSRLPRDQRPKGAKKVLAGWYVQRFFSTRFRHFWDYEYNPRTYFVRRWKAKDIGYGVFLSAVHLGALAAPFHFTRDAFLVFLVGYLITGLGITLSYHRQLAHRSFTTPKLLEYVFAYCGALALQSHPINWVSSHRHHHGSTEQENDVHSPLDGFWWSHMGWLMDAEGTWMRANKTNITDLKVQWFYRHMQRYYALHAIVLPIVGLYAWGGLPYVLWGFFARVVWVWHVTWAVNSVSHVWGFKDWNTSDNSMNNWLVGIFAFGEGWHNNHHAFETSCRHGLKWWQYDVTWYVIKLLSFVGLATKLKYPSESKIRKLSFAAA
jgi:stearoyl-CoA desaturase (delta-9 desaturase)